MGLRFDVPSLRAAFHYVSGSVFGINEVEETNINFIDFQMRGEPRLSLQTAYPGTETPVSVYTSTA